METYQRNVSSKVAAFNKNICPRWRKKGLFA